MTRRLFGSASPVAFALAIALLLPTGAEAIPASGPHGTVDIWTTTKRPGASAGFGYAATLHSATDPAADPPALRLLVIEMPRGTRIDTAVLPRCTASDEEIEFRGESACPPAARVGVGQATVRALGFGTTTFETVLYNARDDILELVMSGEKVLEVLHTYVRGTTMIGPVPTCLTGGNPPSGCPFDQTTLLSNWLVVDAITVGEGSDRRAYGNTPPRCPKSRRWRATVHLHFGDGSTDTIRPYGRCKRGQRKPECRPRPNCGSNGGRSIRAGLRDG